MNYLNHFDNLVGINEFKDIEKLRLEIISENLTFDEIVVFSGPTILIPPTEIVVSSKLAKELNAKINDTINFYFNYKESVIKVSVVIKNIVNNEEYIIYHNSNWSYYFFKEKVGLEQKDLVIKNIVIYDDVKKGYRVSDNAYENALKEVRNILKRTNDIISIVNMGANIGSALVVVLIELFYNKFKKEYFAFLNVIS